MLSVDDPLFVGVTSQNFNHEFVVPINCFYFLFLNKILSINSYILYITKKKKKQRRECYYLEKKIFLYIKYRKNVSKKKK